MIRDWLLGKLEPVRDHERVLVRDPLWLLPEADGVLDQFARQHGFTVIVSATNLAFRQLYETAIADPDTRKLLVVDRTPARRRSRLSLSSAPPLFYPDLLARTAAEARIDVDLQSFLKEQTGDPNWPAETSDPRYARLIARNLSSVLQAHRNLRTAHESRFTDSDFRTIVAFSALGIAPSAFMKLDAEAYWTIGLLGHEVIEELQELTPEVTRPIREALDRAPSPFCWFGKRDPDIVIRAFYLSVILAQHSPNWKLLLANVDPVLAPMADISEDVLRDAAPRVLVLDARQAERDIASVEGSLNREALELLAIGELKLATPAGYAAVLDKEGYSSLFRSLALLMAVDNVVSNHPSWDAKDRVRETLGTYDAGTSPRFVDTRPSVCWARLKGIYELVVELLPIRDVLGQTCKKLAMTPVEKLTFSAFYDLWTKQRVSRLEYCISALERMVLGVDILPRSQEELPQAFGDACVRIRQRVQALGEETRRLLDDLNKRYQDVVQAQYPAWVASDKEPVLTSQFLRRCLKPHWDPKTENAALFIFDGMRWDIWNEFLRPMLADRMEVVAELPGMSLLPSETHITRKAISAGTFPDSFDRRKGEDELLKAGLARELGVTEPISTVAPAGAGTGETVRYRTGRLDVFIFELCDKELHGIRLRQLPDGREVPGRPLAFVYEQHIKNILDTEVLGIMRSLAPGTKVFITADHGFGPIGREKLWLDDRWLNEPQDCSYLNAWLFESLKDAMAPAKVRQNALEFPVAALRMPAKETVPDKGRGGTWEKTYATIIFPKVGFAFNRPGASFNPDAFSHGGVSLPEMLVPMVVLRVKPKDEGLLALGSIAGPEACVEGEEIEFRLRMEPTTLLVARDDIRVDVEASYAQNPGQYTLPRQVLYVTGRGAEVLYRFRPDPNDATEDERREGTMQRAMAVSVAYRDGVRTVRVSRTHRFAVRLNADQIVRRVGNLGSILGLTPKGMR